MKVHIGKYSNNPNKSRKISVQIDDWDTWSLDHTLTLIILPALKQYRDHSPNTGHPCMGPGECDGCTCHAKWITYLDSMIWSFTQIADADYEPSKEIEQQIQDGLDLFAKYFRALWT